MQRCVSTIAELTVAGATVAGGTGPGLNTISEEGRDDKTDKRPPREFQLQSHDFAG